MYRFLLCLQMHARHGCGTKHSHARLAANLDLDIVYKRRRMSRPCTGQLVLATTIWTVVSGCPQQQSVLAYALAHRLPCAKTSILKIAVVVHR